MRDKPGTTLEAFQGEDGKLTDPDGTVTFRQVKKRDVASAWRLSADDFKRLVQNALNEVAAGDHVVFEFYTNGRILPDLVEITDRGTVLRAGHPDIAAMLAGRDPRLCSRVVFFEHHGHTDPRHLEGQIRWALEDMVRADNPTALALAIVNVQEIAILAQKLLAAEPLLINQGKVTWQDVDAKIGYQSYLATVRACLLGGQALLPITDLDALDAQLPEDAGEVLKAIREGRSIPRERIEAEILQDLQTWLAAPTRAPIRGALVLGAHGSGRTHLLMRLLAQLTKEPGLQVHIASSIDPDPNVVVPALGIERKDPLVLLIDDASEEWISILSAPSGYFRRVYFVATSASPKTAPDLEYLVRQRGSDLHLLELPPSLSAEEATALARVLRPVLPSATELAAAMQTNIRGAVEILANEGCLALVGELGELANDLRDVVTPILACSAMGVVIPRSLLERRFGRALPRELVPYVVTLRRRGTYLIVYESSAVSTRLLHDLLGTARSAVVHYHLGELIENVDPAQKEDRRLARHLLRALWAHDQEAGRSLLRDRKRKFLLILKKEGVHALAFSWLPMVSGIDAELFDACFRPLSQDPSTAAEFALFLRYYGVAEAAKLLQVQLRTRSDWDGWLLAEAGNMIVRLPLPEQREIGRRYTQMLFDLPARMFFEASTRNAFATMMRLLGDHGIPYDRIRAMNLANEFFLFRVADGLPVTSNWVEAYLNLCNRALRQERHRLSLEVARHLVLDQGHPNHARGGGTFPGGIPAAPGKGGASEVRRHSPHRPKPPQ